MKIIKKMPIILQEQVGHIKNEINIMSSVKHPFIVYFAIVKFISLGKLPWNVSKSSIFILGNGVYPRR